MTEQFGKRISIEEVEEGKTFMPKFDENGLIPVITLEDSTGEVLMHGYMNSEALTKSIETREAHYWSRSRKKLWKKDILYSMGYRNTCGSYWIIDCCYNCPSSVLRTT